MKKTIILLVMLALTACGNTNENSAQTNHESGHEHNEETTTQTDTATADTEQNTTAETAEHEHEHAEEGVVLDLQPTSGMRAGEETLLSVAASKDGHRLEDVRVKLEMTLAGETTPTWVTLEASDLGNYEANYTFKKAGTYQVVVHVNGENDLHEHQEVSVTVSE